MQTQSAGDAIVSCAGARARLLQDMQEKRYTCRLNCERVLCILEIETWLERETCWYISVPEVCVRVMRDLIVGQKRPIYMKKEVYLYGKRAL